MLIHNWFPVMIAWTLIAGPGVESARAELPMAEGAAEIGYFVLLKDKKLRFSIDTAGETQIQPLNRERNPAGELLSIKAAIVETQPDGNHIPRGLIADSLETKETPAARLTKTSYHGKADNDAVMEIAIESSHGMIFLGGKILEKGKSINPQHARFEIPMLHIYNGEINRIAGIENAEEKEDEEKAFKKKIRGDSISIWLVGGKRLKYKMQQPIEPLMELIKGAVIEQVELDCAAYPDHKFHFAASPNSEITIEAGKDVPLNMALTICWKSNPEKDTEGKARLALQLK